MKVTWNCFVLRTELLEDRLTPSTLQAVGAGPGGEPEVKVYTPDGSLASTILAFEPEFEGGVRVAVGDLNGDGTPDVIAGSGPGRVAEVRAFDGKTGAELSRTNPFGDFTGGVYVAAGDVNGDGRADIAVSPDLGGGPRVRMYSGSGLAPLVDFFGINDPGFRGGARVAIGDVNKDGHGDLVVAAGFGGGPRISTWDGAALAQGQFTHPFGDLFAFPDVLRNGVFLAVGDVSGDGYGDLVAGAGPGGGPQVVIFSGQNLLAGQQTEVTAFFAGPESERNGVPVAVADLDGDGRADVLTGTGAGSGAQVQAYLGKDCQPGAIPPVFGGFNAFPGFSGGAFVGGAGPGLPTPLPPTTPSTPESTTDPDPVGPPTVPDPPAPPAQAVYVSTTEEFRAAVNAATPGTTILLRPGTYTGGLWFSNVQGTADKAIVIGAADPTQRPVIQGGLEGLQISNAAHLVVRDLIFEGQTDNGINLDDGGNTATPAHDITLQNLVVRNVGGTGNQDGIKLSGVDRFLVTGCVIEAWGAGGSGVDMVGCHDGTIDNSVFRNGGGAWGNGVEAKGGSARVTVQRSRFEDAGVRAIQAGGNTGLEYFRPQPPPGYEAKDITIQGNVIVGSETAIAFVGVDGATARFNTIYNPGRWPLRILQETTSPGFVPCRNGVFTDNIVAFNSAALSTMVNVGPGTAPDTFQFARNWWYAMDNPAASLPSLPTAETAGVYGVDPGFVNAAGGDFHLQAGSPANVAGAYAFRG